WNGCCLKGQMRRRAASSWTQGNCLPACVFSDKTAAPMRIRLILVSMALACASAVMAQSPYESAADFAKYARKLRDQALLKVEPQVFVPTASRTSTVT